MNETRIWVVRVPKGQDVIQKVQNDGVVAIGFAIKQDISGVTDKERLKDLYRAASPEAKERRVSSSTGQLYRFVHSLNIGDWVLTPDRDRRTVLFGKIKTDYSYSPNILTEGTPHSRQIEWLGEFSRDSISTSLKNSIGSLSTVFNMDKHRAELLKLMQQPTDKAVKPDEEDETEETVPFYDDTKAKADDLIADMISEIDAYDFQDLVAGLLQTMGYRTRVSEPGPDHGVDIVAHPDAFGFETPRIKVQVKHRQASAGGPDIRNLIGTLGEGEKGLFVSTGGFTSEAKIEARRHPRIALVDSDEFVKLLTENYQKMNSDYRAIIPLRRIWVPFPPQ
jgi:restriction system protein